MKDHGIGRHLASTGLGFILLLSSHVGMAEQNAPGSMTDIERVVGQAAPAGAKQDATVPAESVAPAAASPTTADSGVTDQLRKLITGNTIDRLVSRKPDRAGMEAFYNARNFAPMWLTNNVANERAKSAIAYLAQADAVGLDPSDYPVPDFKSASTTDALAEAELKLTASVLTFARHAQIGRIHFTRVGTDIQYELLAPDPADALAKLVAGDDAGTVLDSFNPPQPEFAALRAKLAELRKAVPLREIENKPQQPRVHVPEGGILQPGMKDARVVALRKRLDIAGDRDNELYDEAVRDAVKAFQMEADISVDGNLGPNTVRALNSEHKETHGHSADPIDTIIVNMERWRWLPRDLGNPHVIVNVPDYTLTLYNDGKPFWHTKIVAGKPGKATPMVSADMKSITANPTWNVPPSIIENEYLPALEEDPQALDRIGLKVDYNPDGTIHIWQPPGAGNALGRIRFNFPNKFLVYQHDTPDKYLFARERRAYSHGCMRVENPIAYAEKLLLLAMPNEHYSEARLEHMFGGNEININFTKFIPVHLTYQTAFVDDHGELQLREDVYGRDARMIAILKGERKVADVAIERRPDASAKSVRLMGGYYSGPGFFGFLFGGPQFGPPRPPGYIGPRAH